ncbi:MAG: hypothetical protein KJP08_03785 [Gammaproteobacteria bacterium]|nr:hypothetical protein [Gammaproteobacteria bacterium]MBT8093908.1 hypothetical protein [Gammaproteobacteria bacterium]MBT8105484.1 hypothetical protein [Gammaproteobacteria bacterium]NNF48294.1 hypothetical protein [Woeseiaceae bacterium]NNK25498.1 hypothetical protein [Woeseiaceae bacterium]
MLLRRITEHVNAQNWTAIFLDFVIVVVGVFVGLQAQEWNAARQDQERLDRIVASLKADMADARRVEAGFLEDIRAGLAAFEDAYGRGERPAPFVYRIKGSDTAPKLIWGTLQDAGLGALLDPQLLFELSHFYSERDGIGVKITRYMASIEQDVLPYLDGDPAHFYDPASGDMHPRYRATMDRLREWGEFVAALGPWSRCLENRLESASEPGASCRTDYFTDFGE